MMKNSRKKGITMEPECRLIGRSVLPAVRASIAEQLRSRYRWKQRQIAAGLGVVQVAVSKYLNSHYSADVLRIRAYILKRGLTDGIAAKLASGRCGREIDREIDRLCATIVRSKALS